MAIPYDEIWITTSREIKVCLDAIKAYQKELRRLGSVYGLSPERIHEKVRENMVLQVYEARWYDTYLALKRSEQRLVELKTFLER